MVEEMQMSGIEGRMQMKMISNLQLVHEALFILNHFFLITCTHALCLERLIDPLFGLLTLQAQELDDVQQMRNTPDFFNKLVDSIAPAVFGHQDIKRAILLMLMGGVHKVTHEGINLRGDINVCIVGDPSCAKSQFLKYTLIHVCGFVHYVHAN